MGQQPTKAESYRHAASALTSDQLLIIKKQFSHLVQRRPPPHRAGFVCGGDSRAYAGPLARPPPPGCLSLQASRTDDEGTIDKDTFLRFIPLPGMLGERLFRVCDRDRDNAIDFEEFVSAVCLLVHGTEEERYRFLYDVRDPPPPSPLRAPSEPPLPTGHATAPHATPTRTRRAAAHATSSRCTTSAATAASRSKSW